MMVQDKGMNGEMNAIRVYEQHNMKDVTVLLVSSGYKKLQKRDCVPSTQSVDDTSQWRHLCLVYACQAWRGLDSFDWSRFTIPLLKYLTKY